MTRSFIALIFPEYDDVGNNSTSFDWNTVDLPDDKSIGDFINKLSAFVDFFSDEECGLLYDAKNVSAYTYAMRVLPECYPGRVRSLRTVLKRVENWRKNRESTEDEEYVLDRSSVKDEMRTEIASRMASKHENRYLLSVGLPNYVAKEWKLSKGGKNYCIDSAPLSIREAFEWMSLHHFPQRVYNWNPKHGENGMGAHPDHNGEKVSVLLCSREHAGEIMQKAIGVPHYDCLYCYDVDYDSYMEYKAECKFEHLPADAVTRNYHSYHLENDSAVPNRVKKKLDILLQ